MPLTVRQKFARAVRGEMEGKDELIVSEIASAALRHCIDGNEGFLEAFGLEYATAVANDVVRAIAATTRQHVSLGPALATKGDSEERRERESKRIMAMFEHAGTRSVRFGAMQRDDLLLAATHRELRSHREKQIANFERTIAAQLKPGERVEDRFTHAALFTIASSIGLPWSDVTEVLEGAA